MAKISMATLNDKIDQVKQAQGNVMPCVTDKERNRAKMYLSKVGLELIKMLEGDLNAHAKKLVAKAESVIDRNVKILGA